MHTITIFKSIKATAAGYNRNVKTILQRIQEGKSLSLLKKIREAKDDESRNKLKQSLPSICFSGTFRQRNDKGLVNHSGLICLDFDKFPDQNEMDTWRSQLTNDQYTFALFTSPSGDGLKIIVKIPPEPENHKSYFSELQKYYDCKYFDVSCSNVSRVCYESFDPNLYYNEISQLWTLKTIPDNHQLDGCDNPVLKIDSENRIISNLITWYNKLGTSKGNRNNNIYKLSAALNDFGVSKGEAYNTLRSFAQNDFTENEIDNIIDSAYKNTANHGSKAFEDVESKQKIERQIRAGKSLKKIAKSYPNKSEADIEKAVESIRESLAVSEFWYYDDKGNVKLTPHRYKEYLEQQGFLKLYPAGGDQYIFVSVDDNLVDNIASAQIKDYVLNYLYSCTDFGLKPYDMMANQTKYFKDDYLSLVKTADIDFKEDTADSCYIYFRNCAIEVKKDEITEIDYLDLNGHLWRKHIIERDYENIDHSGCIYQRFLKMIAGDQIQRYNSFRSVIGYLLHSYKTSADNRAIILNDEEISEHPNGGSGKGLFCAAIGYLKRMSTLDGKQFDFAKSFAYQTVGADTQVLVFDDVKKNFAFENLFSLVTEGITLEKKNKDAIKMPIQKSPKIVITTNYTIGGVGASFERRKFEIELSSHFGIDHTPLDEFGSMMFEGWDDMEWSKFDNFMISCLQYYLDHGLVSHQYQNLEVRKFIKATSFEFYEWCMDESLPFNFRINRSEYYIKFIEDYSDMKKWLTQKRFAGWIEEWGRFKNAEVTKGKGEFRWIMLSLNKEPMPEDIEVPF